MTANRFHTCIGSAILVSVVLFSLIAFRLNDPHWVNRGGAFIAATATLMGYFQIRFEINAIKAQRERPLKFTSQPAEAVSPIEALTSQLERKTKETILLRIDSERIGIATAVVTAVAIGELLHGFGDLLFQLIGSWG